MRREIDESNPPHPVILALDYMPYIQAIPLMSLAAEMDLWGVKIPPSMLQLASNRRGAHDLDEIIKSTRARGVRNISYDVKSGEEPDKMADDITGVSKLIRPPAMYTVQLADTTDMRSLQNAVRLKGKMLIIGFTVSSMLDPEHVAGRCDIGEKVRQLGGIAAEAGLDGITVPQRWLEDLNQEPSTAGLLRIVSGISDPEYAVANRADFLIAGRMVTKDARPEAVLENFVEASKEIKQRHTVNH